MLCALHTASSDISAYRVFASLPTMGDGHVARSAFMRAYPQYGGRNLWDPKVFNPSNSSDPKTWLYDPHLIADDRPRAEQVPAVVRTVSAAALSSTPQVVLPDFYPRLSGTPYMDRTKFAGRALVRFGTQVNNAGLGPAILVGGAANSDGTQQVLQRVYQWTPSTNSLSVAYDRLAGNFTYHPTHAHLHFDGYAKYRLLYNNNGTVGGPVIRPDGTAAESAKVGFCLINVNSSFTLPSGASSTTLSTYGASNMPSTSCGQFQGVNPGRADVYSASLDDQWIDVTGVPDGTYFVEISLDARNGILESDESNNVAVFAISVTGNGAGAITPDRFEPNESRAAAPDLGATGTSTVSGLTLHTGGNVDWYKFTATSTVNAASITAYFTDGDVQLGLYNSAGTLLKSSAVSRVGSATSPASETVSNAFTEGATYYVRVAGQTSTSTSRSYELRFAIPPKVTLTASDAAASESGDVGSITLSRNGVVGTALTVNLTIGGTATRGADYDLVYNGQVVSGNSIIMGVDTLSAVVDIVPKTDALVEGTETVAFGLATASAYVVGSPNAGTISIADVPPLTQLPTVPGNLAAAFNSSTGVTLAWQDAAYETSYAIQWRYQNWVWTDLATPAANAVGYVDPSAARGVVLEYRVRAVNSAGASEWSNTAIVDTSGTTTPGAPAAPSNLVATGPNPWLATLTWTDNATNETGYRVRRRVVGTTAWIDVGEILPAGTTSYNDWSVTPGASYEYVVVALSSAGESAPSNISRVNVPA